MIYHKTSSLTLFLFRSIRIRKKSFFQWKKANGSPSITNLISAETRQRLKERTFSCFLSRFTTRNLRRLTIGCLQQTLKKLRCQTLSAHTRSGGGLKLALECRMTQQSNAKVLK